VKKLAHDLVSAKANLLGKSRPNALERTGGRSQNQADVRFWIITMMLVLFGLSTLKLR